MDKLKNLPDEYRQAAIDKLSELMSSSSAREKHKKETGVDINSFGHRRSREEMLALHEEALSHTAGARYDKKGRRNDSSNSYVTFSSNENVKPQMGTPLDWDSCTPILVAALCVNTTHKRRQLRGKLIVPPAVFSGMASLLEDEAGDLVRVSFWKPDG